jgi:hypothetical protein
VQSFGNDTDVLIRIEQQPGGDLAQQAVVERVRAELGEERLSTAASKWWARACPMNWPPPASLPCVAALWRHPHLHLGTL